MQFGGQTPLNLAQGLAAAGVPIWGTSPETIDLAEDRQRFGALLAALDIPQPAHGVARTLSEAEAIAFLSSPAARCITGVTLPVDSGYLAR